VKSQKFQAAKEKEPFYGILTGKGDAVRSPDR
jgi:hypothetical protein